MESHKALSWICYFSIFVTTMCQHSIDFHCYADDTKHYIAVDLDDLSPLYSVENSISDIK